MTDVVDVGDARGVQTGTSGFPNFYVTGVACIINGTLPQGWTADTGAPAVAGDLGIAIVAVGSGVTVTGPSGGSGGWTDLLGGAVTAGTVRVYMYAKILEAGDLGASITFDYGAGGAQTQQTYIWVLRRTRPLTFDTADVAYATATAASVTTTAPSMTGFAGAELVNVLASIGGAGGGPYSSQSPADEANGENVGSGTLALTFGVRKLTAGGATGTTTADRSNTATGHVGVHVLLGPQPEGWWPVMSGQWVVGAVNMPKA